MDLWFQVANLTCIGGLWFKYYVAQVQPDWVQTHNLQIMDSTFDVPEMLASAAEPSETRQGSNSVTQMNTRLDGNMMKIQLKTRLKGNSEMLTYVWVNTLEGKRKAEILS